KKNVHMDVINNFISENKDILSILITLLVGFIAWICKELIKTPMRQSRETFFKVTEKRIGILSELYNYINIIALFPQETNIKEELQKIILSDKLAYVDEKIIVNIIEIAFKEVTNERLVLDTRKELRETIDKCAEIIRKENQYFLKHDTTNTYKRVIAYFIQLIKAISFIVFILIAIFYLIKSIVFLSVVWIIFCCIFKFAVMLILEKYII
uniref:hypothetical protein n=1 Tax=Bacteroides faecis TaxID=674529 RepID=UPI001E46F699